MRRTIVLALFVLAVGCSQLTPARIVSGDVCERCKAVISDTRLAGEIIDTGLNVLKFRTVGCMAQFVNQNAGRASAIFVTDYKSGKLVRATQAVFVRATIDEKTRAEDYLAFSNVGDATAAAREERGAVVDWPSVLARTASERGN
jgi:hypothetical protein